MRVVFPPPLLLLALLALALGLVIAPHVSHSTSLPLPDLAPKSVCPVGNPSEMLCLHNYARRRHGLAPLRWRDGLGYSAARKAAAIARTGNFSHEPIAGVAWDAWFPSWANGEAENIAEGYSSKRATFAAWLASRDHHENILLRWARWYGSAHRPGAIWAVDLAG